MVKVTIQVEFDPETKLYVGFVRGFRPPIRKARRDENCNENLKRRWNWLSKRVMCEIRVPKACMGVRELPI